jgi:hypothetical protein
MVCPPNCRIATSKLTRVRNEGFSNKRAKVFPLSEESQPASFISTASDMSKRISLLLRSDIESKSFPFKSTSPMFYSISRKTTIKQRDLEGEVDKQSQYFTFMGGVALMSIVRGEL